MQKELVSRRNFLKVAGLTGAAVGLTACRTGTETAATPTGGQVCLDTIADLRALSSGTIDCATALGYRAPGDGGGGDFYWDSVSAEPENGGTIIVPNSNPPTGRWKRMVNGPLSVKWFGAIGDGAPHPLNKYFNTLPAAQAVYPHASRLNNEIDWAAIQAAINADKTIYVPSGIYYINVGLTLPTGKTLCGAGPANSILRVNAAIVGITLTGSLTYVEQLQLQSNVNTTKPAILIEGITGVADASNWCLRDLYIRANPANNSALKFDSGIVANRAYTALLERITIENPRNFGIKLIGTPNAYLISHCNVANVKTGIYIENSGSGVIMGGAVQGPETETGIEIRQSGNGLTRYELVGIHFELDKPGSTSLLLDGVRCATIIGGGWATAEKAISINNSVVSLVDITVHSPVEINGEDSTVTFVGGEIDLSQINDTTNNQRTQYLGVFDYPSNSNPVGMPGTYVKRLKIGNVDDTPAITGHLSQKATLNFGTVSAQDMKELTIPVEGSFKGDSVIATPDGDPGIRLTWCAYVSDDGTVIVRLMNGSGSNVLSNICEWRVDVWQHKEKC